MLRWPKSVPAHRVQGRPGFAGNFNQPPYSEIYRQLAPGGQLTCNAGMPHCRMKWGCWDEIEATDKKGVWGQGECSCWRGEVRLLLSQWTARLKRAQLLR